MCACAVLLSARIKKRFETTRADSHVGPYRNPTELTVDYNQEMLGFIKVPIF